MQEITDCRCSTAAQSPTPIYRYDPGVSVNVPTPPAQNPNSLGIVPTDPSSPAFCYPKTTDGSGQSFMWNIETAQWV